jgi:hypothetical protein
VAGVSNLSKKRAIADAFVAVVGWSAARPTPPVASQPPADPKLITLIRCKFLFYKGEQAILSVGSCLQSEWYLQQVQGTLL